MEQEQVPKERSPEDEQVAIITKRVVGEVMQVIRPLLEKMEEAMTPKTPPQQSNPAAQPMPMPSQTKAEQLLEMQKQAKEKQELLQQKVENRLAHLQGRTSRFM